MPGMRYLVSHRIIINFESGIQQRLMQKGVNLTVIEQRCSNLKVYVSSSRVFVCEIHGELVQKDPRIALSSPHKMITFSLPSLFLSLPLSHCRSKMSSLRTAPSITMYIPVADQTEPAEPSQGYIILPVSTGLVRIYYRRGSVECEEVS